VKVYQEISRSNPKIENKEVKQKTPILPFCSLFSHEPKTISNHEIASKTAYSLCRLLKFVPDFCLRHIDNFITGFLSSYAVVCFFPISEIIFIK